MADAPRGSTPVRCKSLLRAVASYDALRKTLKFKCMSKKQTKKPLNINDVPNELLHHIFSYLDTPSTIPNFVKKEPKPALLRSDTQDLKNASLVCGKWRPFTMPLLFKHLRIITTEPTPEGATSEAQYWVPLLRPLLNFLYYYDLNRGVASLILCRDVDNTVDPERLDSEKVHILWQRILACIDPLDVVFLTPPTSLLALTDAIVNLDAYYGRKVANTRYHLIHLSRPGPANVYVDGAFEPYSPPSPDKKGIFAARPWTQLLVNEGSFVISPRRMNRDEEFDYSIMWPLLFPIGQGFQARQPNYAGLKMPLIPSTVRDFSYISIFGDLHEALDGRCPLLDRLYLQFVPEESVLADLQRRLSREQYEELWRTRNANYVRMVGNLFLFLDAPLESNFKNLKEFESGDFADIASWNHAADNFLGMAPGWYEERPGVLVKFEKQEDEDEEGSEDLDPDDYAWWEFKVPTGLKRLAFAGVKRLPVSPIGFYGP